MNVSASLQNVRDAFSIISSHPSEKHKPVVIGEDDPDECAARVTPAYGYRDNMIFPSYTAAAFPNDTDLAARYEINFEGALTWAFEFDDRDYFDELRVLTTNKIDKPILEHLSHVRETDGPACERQQLRPSIPRRHSQTQC